MKGALALVLAAVLAACGVPRDPEGTLSRVTGGVLRAGYTHAPPWAEGTPDNPSGVENELVEAFAKEVDAEVEWTSASQAELFKALEVRALDLVVGGFDATDPLLLSAGATRPYATTYLTVGVPRDEPAPADLKGMSILAEPGSEAYGLLVAAQAKPLEIADYADLVGQTPRPAAVEDWMLDDLQLVDSDHHLAESKHAMAVPLGENAWLVALERYLFESSTQIDAAITQAKP